MFFFFQFLSEHLFVFVYYQPKPFYITLTVHREEISSFGSTISTEGSVQTDFFMQLILKPSKGEWDTILFYKVANVNQTSSSTQALTVNVIPKAEFLLYFLTTS